MASVVNPFPPVPPGVPPVLVPWLTEVLVRLSQQEKLKWSQTSKAGSNLVDLETRFHDDLDEVYQADDTDDDTTRDRHVSNAMMKAAREHREAVADVHGATGDIVGAEDWATEAVGGVVLLAAAVADAAVTAAAVPTGTADLTYNTTERDMLNGLVAAVSALNANVAALQTTLNALLAAQRAARQIAP